MYASNTTVTVEKSLEEIRTTLLKVGAEGFSYGNHNGQTYIAFYYQGKAIKMSFSVPVHPGNEAGNAQVKRYEQARRSRWRQIILCLKAKFECISCGIETFDQAFMPYIVRPGMEISEHLGFIKDKPEAA